MVSDANTFFAGSNIVQYAMTPQMVDIREKLAIPEAQWNEASAALCAYDSIAEASVLSTCNRFEIYISGPNQYEAMRDAMDYLHKRSGGTVDLATLKNSMFMLSGEDAAWHLLRVSAGLDSLVVGEQQILTQVKSALTHGSKKHPVDTAEQVASSCEVVRPTDGSAGKVIGKLLASAVNAGKRVRAETAISKGTCSISSAAAEFCLTQLGRDTGIYNSLGEARVAIIGAGKMTRLLLINLKAKGVKKVTIVNRSLASIEKLREQFPELKIEMKLMDSLYEVIQHSEVVFTSTSSEVPIITPDALKTALSKRETSGGVQLIDISVPRNVHADCDSVSSDLHPVKCYNVDDLNAVVAKNTAKRRKEIVQAESILREELKTFTHWQQSQGAVPTIVKLRQKAETMRLQTLETFAKKLKDLNPKDKRTVENLTHTLINKFVTGPVAHLQKTGGDDNKLAAKHLHQAFEL
eukprot:gene23183-29378_t